MGHLILAFLCLGTPGASAASGWQAADSAALGAALTHARTVITRGSIQVSPDTVDPGAAVVLEAAARVAGFSYGSDREAIHDAPRGSRAVGSFRGLVHVFEYRPRDLDNVVVTLRMLRFQPDGRNVYEQVDEVHVGRSEHDRTWRIAKVVGITVS
jgi:hypothetical protein